MPQHETDQEYWQALGQFMEAFATAESSIFWALRRYSGVADPVARAIYSGVRVDQGISFLRRLFAVSTVPEEPEVEEALAQLKRVNEQRNDIIHFGSSTGAGGHRVVTTRNRALKPEDARENRVSARLLLLMAEDVAEISLRLMVYSHNPLPKPTREESEKTAETMRKAWRYKPDAQPQNQARSRARQNRTGGRPK